MDEFKTEISKMKEVLSQVQKTLWEPKSQLFDLTIPLEFIDIYSLFEKNEFDKEMTYSILKKTIEQLPVALKSDPVKVTNFFHLVLRRLIPIKLEVPLSTQQRKIMMFVGPTGVGKTTTIAKLAARYAYKLGENYKVGVITLDSFRVGAVEQLKAYTNIMRLPLEVVKTHDELEIAIKRLSDCHYILIDTAGSSQYDMDKIELINYAVNFLKRNNIEPKIALLSGGRLSDYGRSKEVDRTIEECEEILKYFKGRDEKLDIRHNGILIEEVLKEGCNIIIAPDGNA